MKDDNDDYRERARERAKSIGNKRFKLSQGRNLMRLLRTPQSKTTPSRFYEYAMHYDVGPQKRAVRCGKDPQTLEGKCWLCDVQIPKLRKMGKETRAAKMEPKPVFSIQIATVKKRRGKLTFRGPILFQPTAQKVIKPILALIGSATRTYDDPKKGFNFSVVRDGEGLNSDYSMFETDQESSRVPSDIIGRIKPFSELREIPMYNEVKMKATYRGGEDEEDLRRHSKARDDDDDADEDEDDEDEDEKPAKKGKKSTPAKKKKSKSDDDDEEDEDEDEEDDDDASDDDEDEDEDEKPVKKSKKSSKKTSDDDDEDSDDEDDEDDEDEDEDEDEKPSKKSKKSKSKKKSKSDDDDDEDDEDSDDEEDEDEDSDDDDEDDEDEKPAKKSKKKPAVKASKKKSKKSEDDEDEDSDDDEDEDAEEDDEDEKPVKQSKKAEKPVKKGAAKAKGTKKKVPVVKK